MTDPAKTNWFEWFRDKVLPWVVISLLAGCVKLYIDVQRLKDDTEREAAQDRQIEKMDEALDAQRETINQLRIDVNVARAIMGRAPIPEPTTEPTP